MFRMIVGILAGPVPGCVLLVAMEAWVTGLYPLPGGHDPGDLNTLAVWVAGLPGRIIVLWLVGWVLAAAAAAALATAVAGRRRAGLVSGLLLLFPAWLLADALVGWGAIGIALILAPVMGTGIGTLVSGSLRLESVSEGTAADQGAAGEMQ